MYRTFLALLVLLLSGVIAQAQDNFDNVTNVGASLHIQGRVIGVSATPVEGAVVEIWQTDANGNYDHPRDTPAELLLDDFQYFGTATTDADGAFEFFTIKPAMYETIRPPHIHFKVKVADETVLTSQWYFSDDSELAAFAQAAPDLVLQLETPQDESSPVDWVTTIDVVIITPEDGAMGAIGLTTQQMEGPYYPVVDFSAFDNTLIEIATDTCTRMPWWVCD